MPRDEWIQNLFNELLDGHRAKRALTQLTLRRLIDVLDGVDPERRVAMSMTADSYRGYYADLAFEPFADSEPTTAGRLAEYARSLIGQTFEGYKGGDFVMDEHTPLWVACWGDLGHRLTGLDTSSDPIMPVLHEDAL